MASQPGYFNLQEFTDAGALLVGGRLYTYDYGTTTQKTAYTDAAGLIAHTYTLDGSGGQYIALNSRGELPAPLYLASGSYDITLKRSDGSTVWTRRADGVDGSVNYLTSVSGTNTIAASLSGLTTYTAGQSFPFVAANTNTGAVTLNINSLGAKAITKFGTTALAAGDIVAGGAAIVIYDGTQFQLLNVIDAIPLGECRLTKSGANLLLSPFNGNHLTMNGVVYKIPSAGVTLAAPATTLTLYYIYAFISAGVMTLEASATTHATDTTTGVEIKSGDATRTLVGMARTVGSAWVDSATQRFVRSWFNRQRVYGVSAFTADRATTSTSYVEINSEIRVEFLVWSDDGLRASVNGAASSNTAAQSVNTTIGFDGAAVLFEGYVTSAQPAASAGFPIPVCVVAPRTGLAEGYHFATLVGLVSANTGSWTGSVTTSLRTVVTVDIG